ncbi:MAG: YigZ family protein [Chitinophagia bacterium]|nr:YigZ family protein [Chitinophagia bacterium]
MDSRPTAYITIEEESTAEFTDRGSRFLAYALPIPSEEAFRDRLRGLRKDHPKAAHHCFAWRLGTDGHRFRASDDGEPPGSAGRPILGQLDSRGVTNAGIIVVRYFGGTLLGVPGLIHAYRSAAALALQIVPLVEKPIEDLWRLDFDYTLVNEVMTVLKRHGCTLVRQEMQLFCQFTVGIPRRSLDACLPQLRGMYGVEMQPA